MSQNFDVGPVFFILWQKTGKFYLHFSTFHKLIIIFVICNIRKTRSNPEYVKKKKPDGICIVTNESGVTRKCYYMTYLMI